MICITCKTRLNSYNWQISCSVKKTKIKHCLKTLTNIKQTSVNITYCFISVIQLIFMNEEIKTTTNFY